MRKEVDRAYLTDCLALILGPVDEAVIPAKVSQGPGLEEENENVESIAYQNCCEDSFRPYLGKTRRQMKIASLQKVSLSHSLARVSVVFFLQFLLLALSSSSSLQSESFPSFTTEARVAMEPTEPGGGVGCPAFPSSFASTLFSTTSFLFQKCAFKQKSHSSVKRQLGKNMKIF